MFLKNQKNKIKPLPNSNLPLLAFAPAHLLGKRFFLAAF
jgi:hypothetical protein